MKMTKEQLSQQHKDDKVHFKKIKGIMVISAKHMHHYWHKKHWAGLYSDHHVYNWRVTDRTHNLNLAKVGRLAKVIDKQGKAESTVMITHISDVTGSVAKKIAMKLKPVIIFKDQALRNGQIVDNKER